MSVIILIACLFLAYSNGANDNFKGVATLFGSKTTSYKKAINWATITTLLGSIASIFLADALVKNFSGKGLVPVEFLTDPSFATSIALGAGLTVFLATKIGMPISTTHSLVGALFGAGIVAVGLEFNFVLLAKTFLVPLLVSPLMALLLSFILYSAFNYGRKTMNLSKETCLCVGDKLVPLTLIKSGNSLTSEQHLAKSISLDEKSVCIESYQGQFFGISLQSILDKAHYFTAGVVSFARGLNDTPKIMGLLLVVQFLEIEVSMILLAIAIAVGGLLNAKKVAETMSNKITPMNHGQGFTANLVTGLLVTTASIHGMPVSTTHVSVGSIFGIGLKSKKADFSTIRNILLSWILTLPIGAILTALFYIILK